MPVRWVRSIASLHELARFPGDVLHCAEDRGGEGEAGGGEVFRNLRLPECGLTAVGVVGLTRSPWKGASFMGNYRIVECIS